MEHVNVIRFTGGEPLMSQAQIDGMVNELSVIENQTQPDLTVIQTNAINVEKRNLDGFNDLTSPVLFEVSFKGTNVTEYRYLTFSNPILVERAKKIFDEQVEGYKHLVDTFEEKRSIEVLARLGIFHSGLKQSKFRFVYPCDQKRLMFNPKDWDADFRQIYLDQQRIWNGIFDGKMVIERIKTRASGVPGMGQRYGRVIQLLRAKNLVIVDESPLPKIFGQTYYYGRGNEIYQPISHIIRGRL